MNSYALGIDIGTTYTAAGITRRGTGGALVGTALELGSRKAAMPTVAYLAQDGAVVVGEPAERRAIDAPDRVVRGFKRRIGDETPLIVGDLAVAPEELFALLAGWVVERAEEQEGEPPTSITISHPAAWGAHRIESIRGALEAAGLGHADLVSEPEAAGLKYLSEHHLDDGRVIAVYDLGGGTFDVALLRRSGEDGLELVGAPEASTGSAERTSTSSCSIMSGRRQRMRSATSRRIRPKQRSPWRACAGSAPRRRRRCRSTRRRPCRWRFPAGTPAYGSSGASSSR